MKSLALILMTALSLPALAEDGWVDLFHGNKLDGWTLRNGTASYKIEGDSIGKGQGPFQVAWRKLKLKEL